MDARDLASHVLPLATFAEGLYPFGQIFPDDGNKIQQSALLTTTKIS